MYVPLVLVLPPSYALHVIFGFIISVQVKLMTLLTAEILCHKCFSEIISAAIASVKEVSIENDKFHVGPTFKYLGDTISHAVAFLVQSLHVLFHSRKHSKNC